jgi:hypothetical protein
MKNWKTHFFTLTFTLMEDDMKMKNGLFILAGCMTLLNPTVGLAEQMQKPSTEFAERMKKWETPWQKATPQEAPTTTMLLSCNSIEVTSLVIKELEEKWYVDHHNFRFQPNQAGGLGSDMFEGFGMPPEINIPPAIEKELKLKFSLSYIMTRGQGTDAVECKTTVYGDFTQYGKHKLITPVLYTAHKTSKGIEAEFVFQSVASGPIPGQDGPQILGGKRPHPEGPTPTMRYDPNTGLPLVEYGTRW